MAFNKLLQRQIKKAVGNTDGWSEKQLALLQIISESYDYNEKDRKMLERSMDLSSHEMIDLNNNLRKEADARLHNNEHKFKSLIENTFDAIAVINMQSEIAFISDSVKRVLGFETEDLVGKKVDLFLHPEDLLNISNQLGEVISNHSSSKMILIRIRKNDCSYAWCEGAVTNLTNDPAVGGFVLNFRDITERKEHEDAIEKSLSQLKKSNQELDKFVYSVSHDLRAPLLSMLGIVDITESSTSEEMTVQHMNMIRGSITRLDSFIAEILDYSRNARMELKRDPIDFRKILDETTSDLKHMREETKPVDVRIEVKEEDYFVSDKTRIEVILKNLISNSIRYANPNENSPYVNIRIKSDSQKADIEIEDNGIGINEEYHQKIFEMFYRVSENSTGSGLGLYIVKETVDRLYGTLSIQSKTGKGTTFNISIPNAGKRFYESPLLITNY